MSSEADLSDASLIDLFRSEVETHAEVLSTALLALERAPGDTSGINEMMRAAHSIKGAAQIVGVDPGRPGRSRHGRLLRRGAKRQHPALFEQTLMSCFVESICWRRFRQRPKIPDANLEQIFSGSGAGASLPRCKPFSQGAESPTSSPTEPPDPPPPCRRRRSHHFRAIGRRQTGRADASKASDITIVFPEILDSGRRRGNAPESSCSRSTLRLRTIRFDLRATRDLDVQGLAFLAAVPRHLASHGHPSLQSGGSLDRNGDRAPCDGLG